jgi:hypothetical protein
MADTFDADQLSKYLGGESDAAIIAQFYNETSQVKGKIRQILISPKKDSLVVELYGLRNGLHGLLKLYANIDATEQFALAEDVDFANLDAGIDAVYKSSLLSHNLSTDTSAQDAKDSKQYVKLMKEAHEKKAKS